MAEEDRNKHDFRAPESAPWQSSNEDTFDPELDTLLAQYAVVEPRAGLEERVLANLRAGQKHAPIARWWRWAAVAALTAGVLVVVASLMWKTGRPEPGIVAHRPPTVTQDGAHRGTQVTSNGGGKQIRVSHPASVERSTMHVPRHAPAAVASGPRLEQFPSPRPLSEQEEILQSYVARYPEHAALIAQARAEALRQDLAEEMKDAAAINDSQQ